MTVTTERTNLVGRSAEEIAAILGRYLDQPYRGRQVAHWVLERDATSFAEMTSLPRVLRRQLEEHFALRDPEVATVVAAPDGARKYLFRLVDGTTVEGVAIPDGPKLTLCLSSQAGCALGCTFCATGALGAGRNLTASEIVGQYRVMARTQPEPPERINIVFMGMGEPLLNTAHLGSALDVLVTRISPKRITVSTAGVIPGIRWLARLQRRPKLAVSLNAPDQERRALIMPIARRYPLLQLFAELGRFPLESGRRITFEYVLLRGFNDTIADADLLADLLRGLPSKVNLIPYNEDEGLLPGLHRPSVEAIDAFAGRLHARALTATVRWSRGAEVAAACGQLKGERPSGLP